MLDGLGGRELLEACGWSPLAGELENACALLSSGLGSETCRKLLGFGVGEWEGFWSENSVELERAEGVAEARSTLNALEWAGKDVRMAVKVLESRVRDYAPLDRINWSALPTAALVAVLSGRVRALMRPMDVPVAEAVELPGGGE